MTDDDMIPRSDTTSPERIWAWNTANCNGDWTIAEGLGVEYVRADVALAMVAAALGEPAAYFYRYSDPFTGRPLWRHDGRPWNGQEAQEVKPLYAMPADALAALDRVKEEARREAYREGWNDAMKAGRKLVPLEEPSAPPPKSRVRVVALPVTSPDPHHAWAAYSPERRDIGKHYAATEQEAMDKAWTAIRAPDTQEGEG